MKQLEERMLKTRRMNSLEARLAAGLLVGAMTFTGCAKAKTAGTTDTGTTTSQAPSANIVGQVSTTAAPSSHHVSAHSRYSLNRADLAVTCSVTAYDLVGNTALATGTSSSSGKFVLTGGSLAAGTSYKVVSN